MQSSINTVICTNIRNDNSKVNRATKQLLKAIKTAKNTVYAVQNKTVVIRL